MEVYFMTAAKATRSVMHVDDKGRLTLSSALRKKLGIAPGDVIFCKAKEGRFICAKAINPLDKPGFSMAERRKIRESLADIKAGRVTSWEKAKEELE